MTLIIKVLLRIENKNHKELLKVIEKGIDTFKPEEGRDYVMLKAASWYRDSHGLFDFEARNYTHSEFYFK